MKVLLKRLLLTAAMLGLLAGCATKYPGMKDWSTLREADFMALRPGQTKEDVIKALGTPYQQMRFAGQNEEVWDYQYPDHSFTMLAWVYFDERGVYKRYTAQLHPGIYSSAGN